MSLLLEEAEHEQVEHKTRKGALDNQGAGGLRRRKVFSQEVESICSGDAPRW